MTAQQGLWADLQTNLQKDFTLTHTLKEMLENERKALEQRDYSDFNEHLTEKQTLLIELDQNSKYRQQLVNHLGFEDENAILQSAAKHAPEVAKLWQALSEQWKQCQELNEINDRVSQRTRLVVSQMLDLLRGQEGDSRTYTAKGSTQNHNNGRSITSA